MLAHIGSYVPASAATVGLVDRIFTRIGAEDDLAKGRSTFLVEMIETAIDTQAKRPSSHSLYSTKSDAERQPTTESHVA